MTSVSAEIGETVTATPQTAPGKVVLAWPGKRRLVLCSVGKGSEVTSIGLTPKGEVFCASPRTEGGDSNTTPDRHTVTIAILPRSAYLTRVLELPVADSDETLRMLRLELQADLPLELGPIELSYRVLEVLPSGTQRVEAYVVRRSRLQFDLTAISGAGLEPQFFLPSAAIWSELLPRLGACVAIGRFADATIEAASITGRAVVARTLHFDDSSLQGGRELAEFLRTECSSGDGVTWLTVDQPPWAGDQVQPISDEILRQRFALTVQGTLQQHIWLCAAGAVLAQAPPGQWSTSNILPLELSARRRQRQLRKLALTSAAAIGLSILFVVAALYVSIFRHRLATAELQQQIEAVRSEGSAVGRMLTHLRAAEGSARTSGDFTDLLEGLFTATPGGVSYNSVEVDRDDRVTLRGQAEALSLPFLLPERLEATPILKDVVLRDAGQSNQGAGATIEFRLEAKLEKGDRR